MFRDRFGIDVGARQRPLIKQHFADVVGEFGHDTTAEMKHFVTAQQMRSK